MSIPIPATAAAAAAAAAVAVAAVAVAVVAAMGEVLVPMGGTVVRTLHAIIFRAGRYDSIHRYVYCGAQNPILFL